MKTANSAILDLSVLPEQARQEVTDFYLFLKKKYQAQPSRKKSAREGAAPHQAEEGFIGMWKDRADMHDAAGWVREQRVTGWSRHE